MTEEARHVALQILRDRGLPVPEHKLAAIPETQPGSADKEHLTQAPPLPRTTSERIGSFLLRLVVGIVIWFVVGALAMLSTAPYGGNMGPLGTLWLLATLLLPLWALWGLIK